MNNKELIIIGIIAVIITAAIIISCNHIHEKHDEKPVITISEGNATYIKTITYPDGNFRQFNNNSELVATSFPNETIKAGIRR